MGNSLYFAADLSCVVLPAWLVGDRPPTSLWFRPTGSAADVAVWLLTPETYARCLWQVGLLQARHAAGDYPADRLAEVLGRLASLQAFAEAHFDAATVQSAQAVLKDAGGPRGGLSPPPPLPRFPFDATPSRAKNRWNGSKMRWEEAG